MNEQQLKNLPENEPDTRFDAAIEVLMVLLLAFMPLSFGVVHAWSEMVVIALVGAMALCLALKVALNKDARLVWTWAYLPMVLFILVVIVQLLPLPAAVVRIISPGTYETKTSLLADLPSELNVSDIDTAGSIRIPDVREKMTLSFYPHATEHNLRLILAVAVVFVVIVNIYRRPAQIKRLLTAIMLIGFGIAGLAFAQNILGTDKIYWLVAVPHNQVLSGPFVNHSNYGQFMNLSIGAAVGLVLVRLHESFQRGRFSVAAVAARLGEPDLRIIWYALGMIVLGVATIFLSLTRGGMIAMLIAGSFTALMIGIKRGLKGNSWIITVLLIGSFVCVLYVGYDAVYDRLATLHDFDRAQGGRWQIVRDIAVAWTRFPVTGTGLGTHDVVYPMFDRSTIAALAGHAENEYAQAAEETGGIGLALVIIFITAIWLAYRQNLRAASRSQSSSSVHWAAFGLGFGLLAIMIHSLSDFGQHLPANACLTAVFCGLLIAMARLEKGTGAIHFRPQPNHTHLRKGLVIMVVGGFAWALLGANAARSGESNWNRARLLEDSLSEKSWLGSNEEYTEILTYASEATYHQPKNVRYRHWLNVYRWRAISRVTDPNSGDLVLTSDTLRFTRQIVDELHYARSLCPTFGATYCLIGQLEYFILEDPDGARRIRDGFSLAPCDATACYIAGLLDTQENRPAESLEKFSRAVELRGQLMADAVDVYLYRVNRPDLAVALAGDNIGLLSQVARALSEMTTYQELADQARAEVARLLEEKCAQPDAPASAFASLAGVYYREQNYEDAAEYYGRALALDYGPVHWHLNRARALAEVGQISEAIREARIVLSLQPQMPAAVKLLADLLLRLPEELDRRDAIYP